MQQEGTQDRLARRRDAVQALLAWQAGAHDEALPALDEAALRAGLARFAQATAHAPDGTAWTPAQSRAWELACQRLVASALAQPQVALRDPDAPSARASMRGPLLFDLARLLFDPALDPESGGDEDLVIDAAVRWWQQARRSGPARGEAFAEDFGECWRALEWMALLQHLQRIGALCGAATADDGECTEQAEAMAPLQAGATRIALRYGPLAPVLVRLAPLSGQPVARGFTF